MTLIPGSVRLTGFIAPTDSTDTYPVTDPKWGLGGLRRVSGATQRDSIPQPRRESGMLVYSENEDLYYKLGTGLTNSDWIVFMTGGGSSSFLSISGGTVTGVTHFTQGLSATTFSGGTFYSGGTDLYDIFSTLGSDTTTASNGLFKSGNNITLGGALSANTTIGLETFDFIFSGNGNVAIGNIASPTEKLQISGGSIQIDNGTALKIGTNIIDAGSGFFGAVNYIQMRTAADYSEPWMFMNADGGGSFGRFIQYSLGQQTTDIGTTIMKPSTNSSVLNNNQFAVFDNSGLYTINNNYVKDSVVAFLAAEGSATATVKGSVAIASSAATISNDYTLYTDNLNLINTPINDNSLTQILARNSAGTVGYRDIDSIGNFLHISGGTVTGDTVFSTNISGNTVSLTSTSQPQLIISPVNSTSPVDGSMWFTTSGGTTFLNYQVTGTTKSVELT